MVSGDINALTVGGITSINGEAPPWLFGAYAIVCGHCERHRWSTDRAAMTGEYVV